MYTKIELSAKRKTTAERGFILFHLRMVDKCQTQNISQANLDRQIFRIEARLYQYVSMSSDLATLCSCHSQ